MSQIQKVTEVFIGNGTTLTGGVALPSIASQIAILGNNGSTVTATDTISNQPTIKIVNKNADGTFKISNPIKGTSVTSYSAEAYAPAQRNVVAIGYNRQADAGSIEATTSVEYAFRIVFKSDKSFYSERSEALALSFTSAAGATQETIAGQIANAINSSAFGSSVSGIKQVIAIVVNDGADYGIEVTGLSINQFQNTQYQEEFVAFDIYLDNTSGFGTTVVAKIQGASRGTGTYAQAYNAENKAYGLLNRTTWPVPVQNFLASSTGTINGIAETGTVVAGTDILTLSGAATLRPGEIVEINGIANEIKYEVSTTVKVLVNTGVAAGGSVVAIKSLYDVINISMSDIVVQDGSGASSISSKTVNIFSVAGSDEVDDLKAILNDWMTTTPLSPASI